MGQKKSKFRCAGTGSIVLEPEGDELKITLKGDLAGMLSAARDSKRSPDAGDLMVQISWLRGRATIHSPAPDRRDGRDRRDRH